ncbi:MAG: hypothetical protein PHF37_06695, partial [Phycisphaerae bacterium]|nr:hypothetical protein [Phycisphaerae bacterium]
MSRAKIILFGIVFFICCFSIWQWDNIRVIFREYYSLNYHFNHKGLIVERVISEKRDTDPQLLAVARASIQREAQLTDCLPEIARYSLEFPNNQYFLYQMAFGCSDDRGSYNPAISLILANRLIDLDPDNGLYHYLKSWILLINRKGDDIEPALVELELANACPKFKEPLDSFKPAIISLMESEKISKRYIETLFYQHPPHLWYSHQLRKDLLRYSAIALTNDNTSLAFRIDDAVLAMDKGISTRRLFYFGFDSVMYEHPAALELLLGKHLPSERMRHNRMLLFEQNMQPHRQPKNKTSKHRHESYSLFFAPQMGFMQLLFGCGVIVIVLVSVGFIRGFRNSISVGWKAYIFFFVAVLTYVFAYSLYEYGLYQSGLECCYSYFNEFRPPPVSMKMIVEAFPEIAGFTLVACAPIFAIGAYGLLSLIIRKLPVSLRDISKRILAGLLIAATAFILTRSFFSFFYVPQFYKFIAACFFAFLLAAGVIFKLRFLWIAFFASVFASASFILGYWFVCRVFAASGFLILSILFSLAYGQKKLDTVKQFFLRTNSNRLPALKLVIIGLILSWFGFLCFVPNLANAIKADLPRAPKSQPAECVPGTVIYKEFIKRLQTEPNLTEFDFRFITMMDPNDAKKILPNVISKIPRAAARVYCPFGTTPFTLSDHVLYQNTVYSPKEVSRLFTPYFESPNSDIAVVAKALAGDDSQLPRLFEIYQGAIDARKNPSGPSEMSGSPGMPGFGIEEPPPYIGDVIHAIVMTDSNAATKFLIEQITIEPLDIMDMITFSRYAHSLHREQLNKIIQAYVDRLLNRHDNNG